MPIVPYGSTAPARTSAPAYTGPKVTIVPFYRYPIYRSEDITKKWFPNKRNENGGGLVCMADIHVTIDGLPGVIKFNDVVVSHAKNGGGVIALAAQSYDATMVKEDGTLGGRKDNYDFGPTIAVQIRQEINSGVEALTAEVLGELYYQWEQWAAANDMPLLDYYYNVSLNQPNPYNPAQAHFFAPQVQPAPEAEYDDTAEAEADQTLTEVLDEAIAEEETPAPVVQARPAQRPAPAARQAAPPAAPAPRPAAPAPAPAQTRPQAANRPAARPAAPVAEDYGQPHDPFAE